MPTKPSRSAMARICASERLRRCACTAAALLCDATTKPRCDSRTESNAAGVRWLRSGTTPSLPISSIRATPSGVRPLPSSTPPHQRLGVFHAGATMRTPRSTQRASSRTLRMGSAPSMRCTMPMGPPGAQSDRSPRLSRRKICSAWRCSSSSYQRTCFSAVSVGLPFPPWPWGAKMVARITASPPRRASARERARPAGAGAAKSRVGSSSKDMAMSWCPSTMSQPMGILFSCPCAHTRARARRGTYCHGRRGPGRSGRALWSSAPGQGRRQTR